jgi:hypothetical protein
MREESSDEPEVLCDIPNSVPRCGSGLRDGAAHGRAAQRRKKGHTWSGCAAAQEGACATGLADGAVMWLGVQIELETDELSSHQSNQSRGR